MQGASGSHMERTSAPLAFSYEPFPARTPLPVAVPYLWVRLVWDNAP